MVVKEYDYIRGNTALAPERRIAEEEKNRKQKKRRLEEQKRAKSLRQQRTRNVIYMAILMALLCGATLGLDSYVYKIQKDLTTLESNLKGEMDINEAIKVELLKISSIDNINNIAEKNIGMVYPDKASTVTIDMSKEYFSHIKEEVSNKKSTSFISKIFGTVN